MKRTAILPSFSFIGLWLHHEHWLGSFISRLPLTFNLGEGKHVLHLLEM